LIPSPLNYIYMLSLHDALPISSSYGSGLVHRHTPPIGEKLDSCVCSTVYLHFISRDENACGFVRACAWTNLYINARLGHAPRIEQAFSPVLAFGLKKEHKAEMRWVWPFKARVSENRDKEEKSSSTGDGRPDFLCVG